MEYTHKYGVDNSPETVILPDLNTKKVLVKRLIRAYKALDIDEKIDFFVPGKAEYLNDKCFYSRKINGKTEIDFHYNWDEKNKMNWSNYNYRRGGKLDRLGSPCGGYLCVADKKIYDINSRSLPYYFSRSPSSYSDKAPAKYSALCMLTP